MFRQTCVKLKYTLYQAWTGADKTRGFAMPEHRFEVGIRCETLMRPRHNTYAQLHNLCCRVYVILRNRILLLSIRRGMNGHRA
jgi:hypothetical protein